MENTTISKTEQMVEQMMISFAIQEAINAKAIYMQPEQQAEADAMIAVLASQFKPAEA